MAVGEAAIVVTAVSVGSCSLWTSLFFMLGKVQAGPCELRQELESWRKAIVSSIHVARVT